MEPVSQLLTLLSGANDVITLALERSPGAPDRALPLTVAGFAVPVIHNMLINSLASMVSACLILAIYFRDWGFTSHL